MKTASSLLQILALGACFAVQVQGSGQLTGVRRAMQTMASVTLPTTGNGGASTDCGSDASA